MNDHPSTNPSTNLWALAQNAVALQTGTLEDAAARVLMLTALDRQCALLTRDYYGSIPDFKTFREAAEATGARLVGAVKLPWFASTPEAPTPLDDVLFLWQEAMLSIDSDGLVGNATLRVHALTEATFAQLDEFVRHHLQAKAEKSDDERPQLYGFAYSLEGVDFVPVGPLGAPLLRENYSPEVLRGFDRFVQAVNAPVPPGRLLLVTGPTGTGKTRLVYGALHALPSAVFVLVQPALVQHLADPSLLPSLLRLRERLGPDRKVVFWIEEADAMLVERAADNMAAVASLLALGDGPLGDALGLFVVATTNAGHTKLTIDPALLRKMRLLAHLHVEALTPSHAAAIWQRLRPEHGPLPADTPVSTLSEVYALALEHGWTAPAPPPVPRRAPHQGEVHLRRHRR